MYYVFVVCVHCTVVQYICIIGNKNNNNKINNTVKVAKMRSVGAGGVKNS